MEFLALLLVIAAVFVLECLLYRKYAFAHFDYNCYLSTNEAYEGDEVELIEEISNRKWLPLPWLKSEITTSRWLDFAGAQSVVTDKSRFVPSFFLVKSYQKVRRVWKVKCLQRGEFSIQQVVLVSTDLLGRVSVSRSPKVNSHIVVLPRPLELETLFISPKYLSGDVVVRRHLLEDPFFVAGVREYTSQDPMNKIHWAATAKEQRIMVHNNEYTSRQSLTVILNMQSREFESTDVVEKETMENCIRTCASILTNTLKEQLPVRFLSNASIAKDRNSVASNEYWGEAHLLELLRILARLKLYATEDFTIYLNSIFHRLSSTDVAIVSCYISEEICQFARNQAILGVRVKIFLLGPVNSSDLPSDCEVFCLQDRLIPEKGEEEPHEI